MKLNDISVERITVSESSLSRLLAKTATPYAIVTAYRTKFNKQENIARNRQLRAILNQNHLGVHQLVGHWRECQDNTIPYDKCPPSQLKDVIERSYFVQKPNGLTIDAFKKLLTDLATTYDQDAYILYDGEKVCVVYRDGTHDVIGTAPSLNSIGQAYSQHVKKIQIPFVFEGCEVPTSNIGRHAWKISGLIVPPTTDSQCDIFAESIN